MKKIMTKVMCGVMLFVMIFGMGITGGCAVREIAFIKKNDYIPGPQKCYDYEIQFNGKLATFHTHRFEIADRTKSITTYGAWYKNPDYDPWTIPIMDEWLIDTTSQESYTYVITNQDECDEYFDKIEPVDFDKKMLILHFYTDKINAQRDFCTLEKLVKNENNDITIGFCLMPYFPEDDEKYARPMTRFVVFEMDKTEYNNIFFEIYYKNYKGEDL